MKNLAIILFLLFLISFSPAVAQQLLDEQGNQIFIIENPEYVNNQIIVQFKPSSITLPTGQYKSPTTLITATEVVRVLLNGEQVTTVEKVFRKSTENDTLKTLENGIQIKVPNLTQYFLLSFDKDINVEEKISTFKNSSEVILAQPNFIYRTEDTPSDPMFSLQWGLKQSTNEDISVTRAWEFQKGSYSVKLGIFDTGIDYGHSDLGNAFGGGYKVVGGWDWVNNDSNPIDDNFHGTHVAGISSALTNNTNSGTTVGISGISGGWGYERSTNSGNKGAQVFSFKVFDSEGSGYTSNVVDAIVEAADPSAGGWGYGIQVLNLSAGGYAYDELYRTGLNYVAMMGRVFVAAKGNENTSNYFYPADHDGSWVISVGATNQSGTRAQYPDPGWGINKGSNYGNGIDVVAPGTMILSTMPTYSTSTMNLYDFSTNYYSLSGTSMATPHVAGLATLLISQNPNLHPQDVQGIIRASADDKGDAGYDNFYGAGRINSGRALEYMQSPWSLNHYTTSGGSYVSVSGYFGLQLINPGGGLATGDYYVKRYDVRKTVTFPTQYSVVPYVWGRGVNASVGWSAANPNYQTGYCNVVWSNSSQAQLQTFVYRFFNGLGQTVGWYPSTVGNAVFAYSILGAPLSGPPTIPQNLTVTESSNHHPLLTWTANIDPVVGYKVYKYVTFAQGWQYLATVNGTSYEDLYEYYCTAIPPAQCETGHDIYYRITAIDNQSLESIPSETLVTHVLGGHPEKIAVNNKQEIIPIEYSLEQNFPNPFNPRTRIGYSIKEKGYVSLKIFDVLGNEVMSLVDGIKPAGIFEAEFNAANLPSGIYIYSLKVNEFFQNQKMILLK